MKKIASLLKKIIKWIGLTLHFAVHLFAIWQHRRFPRIFILATPCHGNLGDHAIVYAEKELLKKNCPTIKIFEISNNEYHKFKRVLAKQITKDDIIIIDGGGNLGTLWTREDDKISEIIATYSHCKIIVFPQTCFYDDTDEAKMRLKKNQEIYAKAKHLTISLRDKSSYDFCEKHFSMCKLCYVPDIVLSQNKSHYNENREGCLLCLRTDLERVVSSAACVTIEKNLQNQKIQYQYTDTVLKRNLSYKNREKALDDKWREFASAKLVITDRLHGMIFAVITGTPCLAVDNRSKKVSGVYKWIAKIHCVKVCENIDVLVQNIEQFYKMGGQKYNEQILSPCYETLLGDF